MPHKIKSKTCWIITDGTIGMLNQCIAVTESLKLEHIIFRAYPTPILRLFPRLALIPTWRLTVGRTPDWIKGPHPDYIVTCGRRMAGISIGLRRISKGKSKTIHIQDPGISPKNFDVLIVPSHDKIAESEHNHSNLVLSTGSLTPLLKNQIVKRRSSMIDRFGPLNKKQILVMLGGNNKRYRVTNRDLEKMAIDIYEYAKEKNARLIIIPSRRTPRKARNVFERLNDSEKHFFWDGKSNNPYPDVFSIADEIIVTSDSVNMVTEACLFGLPVLIAYWQEEYGRLGKFHKIMRDGGFTQTFSHNPKFNQPKILDQMPKIANKITAVLKNTRTNLKSDAEF